MHVHIISQEGADNDLGDLSLDDMVGDAESEEEEGGGDGSDAVSEEEEQSDADDTGEQGGGEGLEEEEEVPDDEKVPSPVRNMHTNLHIMCST